MLLDAIANAREREPLYETLSRRISYLIGRAESVSQREPGGSESWRKIMVLATLWIEAAEGTVTLGQFKQAREYLREAVLKLLDLAMPFGAALQRTLLIEDAELSRKAEHVMRVWGRYMMIPPPIEPESIPSDATELSAAARESPQQWAYFALATASADGRFPDLASKLVGMKSVPVGRLRLPLDNYQFIAELRSRPVAGPPPEIAAAEVIAKSLLGLYRSVQWARENRYLWARMLAPAPMFDFDTALLIARTLTVLGAGIVERVQSSIPEDAHVYAVEFIKAVRELRAEPEERLER